MDVLRTPEERFADLPGYRFTPHYLDVDGVRVHYLDEGPTTAPPVLLLHGEPTWSYLYRKLVDPLVGSGLRVVAPDLVGFGRSDKPARREDHTYQRHVDWMRAVLHHLDLRDCVLVGQDWGGLIGLRLVADHPDRFAAVVAANTALPTGDQPMPDAFLRWQRFSQETPRFHVGGIVRGGCVSALDEAVVAAYDAPFPDDAYLAGPRQMPLLVPTRPDDPAAAANRTAWAVLRRWAKPFLCAFSDGDPSTRGAEHLFRRLVPGCRDQPHVTITGAGHFLQEDRGEELAAVVTGFCARVFGEVPR